MVLALSLLLKSQHSIPGFKWRMNAMTAAAFAALKALTDDPDNAVGKALQAITSSAEAFIKSQETRTTTNGWDIKKIGFFYPNIEELFGKGNHVIISNRYNWRNVFAFTDSVRDYIMSNTARDKLMRRGYFNYLKAIPRLGTISLTEQSTIKDIMLKDLDYALTKTEKR
ncbi:hypothetical protein SUNI508_05982 [Seiridium unicorne]|uniref:Uncharacterized protein n=1 Tax=Seiridium unicorne TaxID=138068 RepID=A0ABR2V2S8_9PEZI